MHNLSFTLSTTANKRALIIVLTIALLDAMGIGLIMPVLPTLLRNLTHSENIYFHYGIVLALYAMMQLIFAPILGALSDRFGRRLILLLSLVSATLDYVIMSATPILWVLYFGRIVAGITGATGAVIGAYISDITPSAQRAQRFGYLGAAFGIGMILGPMIGGLSTRLGLTVPFLLAALFNGINFIFSYFFVHESRSQAVLVSNYTSPHAIFSALNPFATFKKILSLKMIRQFLAIFFILQLVGQIPGTLWVIYTEARLNWNSTTVGFSLAAFGALYALIQGGLTGKITAKLGEIRTLILGLILDGLGCLIIAFVNQSWQMLPVMMCMACGAIGLPALQAFIANQVDSHHQGALQGVLTTLTNLTSIIGPLLFTLIYQFSLKGWNGVVWLVGIAFYLLCIPLLMHKKSSK